MRGAFSGLARLVREGSVAVGTAVALLAAPMAQAIDPPPQPATVNDGGSVADAAKAFLPFAIPGLVAGAVGGVMLAKALTAAAAAGAAVTVGTVALPAAVIVVGVGLLAFGSWRAYKALTAKGPATPPEAPTSSPGRNTVPPPAPGTPPGAPPVTPPAPTRRPRPITPDVDRLPGRPISTQPSGVTGQPISSTTADSGGVNVARNDDTRATRPQPGERIPLPTRTGGGAVR